LSRWGQGFDTLVSFLGRLDTNVQECRASGVPNLSCFLSASYPTTGQSSRKLWPLSADETIAHVDVAGSPLSSSDPGNVNVLARGPSRLNLPSSHHKERLVDPMTWTVVARHAPTGEKNRRNHPQLDSRNNVAIRGNPIVSLQRLCIRRALLFMKAAGFLKTRRTWYGGNKEVPAPVLVGSEANVLYRFVSDGVHPRATVPE
jgi:hypothetical protein